MDVCRLLSCLVLAACGDIKTVAGTADGGAPDARGVGSVSVTVGQVFGPDQAIAGLPVLFVDQEGGIVEATTDAAGMASADGVAAGSTMLVLVHSLPAGAPSGLLTLAVVGVAPGDAIVFEDPDSPSEEVGSMTINFPAHPSAASYRVENGCSAAFPVTNTATLTFYDRCNPEEGFDLLIRAADGSENLLGWIGGSGSFTDGGTFTVTGDWTAPEDLAVTLNDIPAEAREASGRMNPIIGDREYDGTNRAPVQLDSDTVELRLSAPISFVESRVVTVDLSPNQPGFGPQAATHRLPADQDTLAISLGDELLPWYGVGVFDGAGGELAWSRSAGRSPDVQLIATRWTEKGAVDDNAIFLMAPPDVTRVVLPVLPEEYPTYTPVAPSDIEVEVFGVDASWFDGYDQARQRGFEIIDEDAILVQPAPSDRHVSAGPNADL